MYEQAEDLSKQIGDQSGVAYALYSLGDVSTAEGSLSAALDYYIESITLRTQIGEKGNIEESQMALALLQFEEGDAIGAENSLREAREEFRKEGIGDDEILADILLARVLLSQGKLADAEKEISAVHDLLAKSQDFSVRLRASIVEAQVQAAAGNRGTRFGFSRTQSRAQRSLDMWDISWRRSLLWAKWRRDRAKL